jgi:hypothetical protein
VAGGGGFAGVDVADDDQVNVNLVLGHSVLGEDMRGTG